MTETEIDILIAEKIFGYKVLKENPQYGLFVQNPDDDSPTYGEYLAHYTKNLNDAFKVIEKVGERFFLTNVSMLKAYESNLTAYCVTMYSDYNVYVNLNAINKSAALAICLCALKTVGINIDLKEIES